MVNSLNGAGEALKLHFFGNSIVLTWLSFARFTIYRNIQLKFTEVTLKPSNVQPRLFN